MPHYSDGSVAEVGDKVTVEFEVINVYTGETACNVHLKGAAVVEGEFAPTLTTNTKFCVPSTASA